jgi:superfamily II RNA helicase
VALLSGALDGLSPLSLAGVVASLLSEECISRPNVYAAYRPSPDAAAAMQQLMPLAVQLEEIQQARSFTAPICLSPLFVGLVESWTAGSDWCAWQAAAQPTAAPAHARVQEASVRRHVAGRG